MTEWNLSDQIVGSLDHKYAFLCGDVREFIRLLKDDIIGCEFPEICERIDKLAGESLTEKEVRQESIDEVGDGL